LIGLPNAGSASEGLQHISSCAISGDRNLFIHHVSEANWILRPFIVDLAENDVIEGKLVEWLGSQSWFEIPNEWKNIWAEILTEVGITCGVIIALEDTLSVANVGVLLELVIIGFIDVVTIWER
jgi:hypothetical protein